MGYYFIKKAGGCSFWPRERESVKDVVIEETEFDDDGKTRIAERKKTLKEKNTEEQVEPDMNSRYSGPKDAIIERKIQSEKDSKNKK